MEATIPWASQHSCRPELSPNHVLHAWPPWSTQLRAAENSHPGHTQMLTSWSSTVLISSSPCWRQSDRVLPSLGETSTDKFIFVHFKFKTWDFYSRSPNPSWGAVEYAATAKGSHFISRERKQINIHDNYGNRVMYNQKMKRQNTPGLCIFINAAMSPHENLRKKSMVLLSLT